jgi:hypothetical protein
MGNDQGGTLDSSRCHAKKATYYELKCKIKALVRVGVAWKFIKGIKEPVFKMPSKRMRKMKCLV